MSKKDVEIYYQQVCDQYNEMIENLKEFEEYARTNVISPERLDDMKNMVEPIKNNFMTLSYIMFLLNSPNRKEKKGKYIKQQQKLLRNIDKNKYKQAVLDESKTILDSMKEIK